MRKSLLYGLAFILSIGVLTGCEKLEKKESTKKEFTITCTDKKDSNAGIETQNVTTYRFNNEQYATSYSIVTTQKFTEEEIYNTYKKVQEETVNSTSNEYTEYNLKSNDKKLTLVFTATIKNLDKIETTEEAKKVTRASAILASKEGTGATCKLDGISKNKLKK